MELTEGVKSLQRELDVIENVFIYDTSSGSFLFEQGDTGGLRFLKGMHESGSLQDFESLFIVIQEDSYFIRLSNEKLVVVALHPQKQVNKVLLELKVKLFCNQFFNQNQ